MCVRGERVSLAERANYCQLAQPEMNAPAVDFHTHRNKYMCVVLCTDVHTIQNICNNMCILEWYEYGFCACTKRPLRLERISPFRLVASLIDMYAHANGLIIGFCYLFCIYDCKLNSKNLKVDQDRLFLGR
jgi:hypothetical protein